MTSKPEQPESVEAEPVEAESVEAESVETESAEVESVDAAPIVPDEILLNAHDLALAALREITPEASIGAPAGYAIEPDGVVSLRFANRLPGYPGWFWTVSVARVDDASPTVLEVELLPGDGALLAPEWLPWVERLAEYHAAQAAAAETADGEDTDGADDDLDDDDLDDVEDLDAADFDMDGSPILHAGDVDGVDIDALDPDEDDSDEDDEDSDDDSDDDFEDDDEADRSY